MKLYTPSTLGDLVCEIAYTHQIQATAVGHSTKSSAVADLVQIGFGRLLVDPKHTVDNMTLRIGEC